MARRTIARPVIAAKARTRLSIFPANASVIRITIPSTSTAISSKGAVIIGCCSHAPVGRVLDAEQQSADGAKRRGYRFAHLYWQRENFRTSAPHFAQEIAGKNHTKEVLLQAALQAHASPV